MRTHPGILAGAFLVALAGFVAMAVLAASNDTFPADIWLAHRVQEIDSEAFARLLDWNEELADLPGYAIVCVLTAVALVSVGDRFGAFIVLLSPAARALNNWALKVTIERPRPSAEHVRFESQPDSFSFPSGHAESAFLLYGLIFYFASIHIHDWRWRLPVQVACVVIIILSGIERVYVGHHWPSDVIGGYYIGALILAGLITVHQLATGLHSNLWPQRSLSRTRVAPGPDELA